MATIIITGGPGRQDGRRDRLVRGHTPTTMDRVSIFEHALPGSNGRWLADDDGVPICVAHLTKACPTCEPPAATASGLVGAAEQPTRIPPGRILGPTIVPGEPIASRMLSADGRWVMDLANGFRCCVGHLRRICHDCGPYPAGELVAAGGRWAAADHDELTDWEPMAAGLIPRVDTADRLPAAIGFAQVHPEARWFVQKRARALGFADAIPRSWGQPPASEPVAAAVDDPADDTGPPVDDEQTAVIVLLPAADDPVHRHTDDAHLTLVYLDATTVPLPVISKVAANLARTARPITAQCSGRGVLGEQDQPVLFTESAELSALREWLVAMAPVREAMSTVDQYPEFIPHVSTDRPVSNPPETITLDRIALWHGQDRRSWPLGQTPAPMDAAAIRRRLLAKTRPMSTRQRLRERVHNPGSLVLR